jgi:hypothetical protein
MIGHAKKRSTEYLKKLCQCFKDNQGHNLIFVSIRYLINDDVCRYSITHDSSVDAMNHTYRVRRYQSPCSEV